MKRHVKLLVATGTGVLLLTLLMVGVAYAGLITIDSFNDGFQDLTVNSGWGGYSTVASSTVDHSSILGGERDAELNWVSGNTDYIYLRIDIGGGGGSNRLAYTSGDGMEGRGTVTWDGDDNAPTTLDATGLGSVDLVSATNDGILVEVVFDDLAGRLTIEAYTDASNWSTATYTLPGQVADTPSRMSLFFPFSAFNTGSGASGPVDFTDVGAVVMEIDGTIAAGLDVTIDLIEASSAREYGDLPASYSTAITTANHMPMGLRLGNNLDTESDGNPSSDCTGDDTAYSPPDDEDGVAPTPGTQWITGTNGGSVRVSVEGCSGTCYLNGWIDWGDNGNLTDAGDQVFTDRTVSNGANQDLTFNIPSGADVTDVWLYARFRICDASGECNSATAQDVTNGEVEDYRWQFGPNAVTLYDFQAQPSGFAAPLAFAIVVMVAIGAAGLVLTRRRRA